MDGDGMKIFYRFYSPLFIFSIKLLLNNNDNLHTIDTKKEKK